MSVILEFVATFEAIEDLALPPSPFVMFIAADARSVPVDVVERVAARLLDAGLVVVCVWGEECERVHDIFDGEYVGDGCVERSAPLMTTWHDSESLEDAVEFFVGCAESLAGDAVSHLAVVVGDESWASVIGDALRPLRERE